MQLEQLRIKNFRCFSDETVKFDQYTCLVGPNGAGKSTVLAALNVLFRERDNSSTDTTWLDAQDFHRGNIADPVEISATFSGLSEDAASELSDYVRHGKLTISAVAKMPLGATRAEVQQVGERLAIAAFSPFFALQNDGGKVADLKAAYQQIRADFPQLPPASTGPAMNEALSKFEAANQGMCELLRSNDEFYGATRGRGKLDRFIQWVYIPAVKDLRGEQVESKTSALGKLLARTVRSTLQFDQQVKSIREEAAARYQQLLSDNQSSLDSISDSLSNRLRDWAHPAATVSVKWSMDSDKAIRVEEPMARALAGELGFEGDLSRLGHGLQRSFVLALLHELASSDSKSQPTLLLGCEEPELYQHPPQARYLASVLVKLADQNSQVIVSTHSPYFIAGKDFEHVRLFRRNAAFASSCSFATFGNVATRYATITNAEPLRPAGVRARIHQTLLFSAAEMFFATKLILVEGPEDLAYLTAHLGTTDGLDRLRAAGAAIVAAASKSKIIELLCIAAEMRIPTFPIWDCDGHVVRPEQRVLHEKDNLSLLRAMGRPEIGPFPAQNVVTENFAAWASEIGSAVKADLGDRFDEVNQLACTACGQAGDVKKHAIYIAELIASAHDQGLEIPSLKAVGESMLRFAEAG